MFYKLNAWAVENMPFIYPVEQIVFWVQVNIGLGYFNAWVVTLTFFGSLLLTLVTLCLDVYAAFDRSTPESFLGRK